MLLASAVLTLLLATPAHAATIAVNETADTLDSPPDGRCSLREAVRAANLDQAVDACAAGSAADTIVLPAGLFRLTLAGTGEDAAATGDLDLTHPTTVAGAGRTLTTVDANSLDRAFDVRFGGTAVFRDLAIRNGTATAVGGDGGAGGAVSGEFGGSVVRTVRVDASGNRAASDGGAVEGDEVDVQDSALTDNVADGNGGAISGEVVNAVGTRVDGNVAGTGGGIFANESLTGSGLTVSNNGRDSAGTIVTSEGGGIRTGGVDLTDSTISGNAVDNVAGGIDIRPGPSTARLTRVTVADNTAQSPNLTISNTAGGISFLADPPSGSLVIEKGDIRGNDSDSGAGILLEAFDSATTAVQATIHDTRIGKNLATAAGGGLFVEEANPLAVTLENSTVDGNRGTDGDGVYNDGALTVRSSTISGNGTTLTGTQKGGGLDNVGPGSATLESATVVENAAGDGGNLYDQAGGGAITLKNTLVADYFDGGDCAGAPPVSQGGNGEYTGGALSCGFSSANGDQTGDALFLPPLAYSKGAATPTRALPPGSPPVDAGSGCGATDQRGVPRPQGPLCDIGAFEFDNVPPQTTITSGPAGFLRSTTARFAFTSSEVGSTFECRLDAVAFTGCASPKSYANLSQGSHSFAVRAIDSAGNVDPVAAVRMFAVDTHPPQTTITSGPSGKTKHRKPAFKFTSSESGSSFQCALGSGAYRPCSSPHTTAKLGFGGHVFHVRARDRAGNLDPTPATRSFKVVH